MELTFYIVSGRSIDLFVRDLAEEARAVLMVVCRSCLKLARAREVTDSHLDPTVDFRRLCPPRYGQ